MTAADERLVQYRIRLDPRRVNELRVEAMSRSVAEGKIVSWVELARELLNNKGVGDGGS